MSSPDTVARIVEFRLLLSRLAEAYVLTELSSAAGAQSHRLPAGVPIAVRTGALAAVAGLGSDELLAFAGSNSWNASIERAVATGAWRRLLEETVRIAFASGPA